MSDTDLLFSQLTDLAEGRLDPALAAQVRAQAAADPRAAADLAWLETTLGLMRSDALTGADAPEHVLNRALRLIRPVTPATPQPGVLRRLIAGLRFDSLSQPLVAGMRSDTIRQRQLLYTVHDMDIDLRIVQDGTLCQISGQILGSEIPGIVLIKNAHRLHETPLNTLSEFTLPAVPAEVYTLTIRLDTIELVIEGLDLTAAG